MRGLTVQQVKFDAKQMQVRLVEHLPFVGSKAAEQLPSMHDKIADRPANVHPKLRAKLRGAIRSPDCR
jgi:hypothetical protein